MHLFQFRWQRFHGGWVLFQDKRKQNGYAFLLVVVQFAVCEHLDQLETRIRISRLPQLSEQTIATVAKHTVSTRETSAGVGRLLESTARQPSIRSLMYLGVEAGSFATKEGYSATAAAFSCPYADEDDDIHVKSESLLC